MRSASRVPRTRPEGLSSRSHAHNPAAEADLAIQARPGEVARVPAARVAGGESVLVVADADDPVALVDPPGAVHQQRALVEPGLELGDGAAGLRAWATRVHTM